MTKSMPQVFMMKFYIFVGAELDMNGCIQTKAEFLFGNIKRHIGFGKRWLRCIRIDVMKFNFTRRNRYEY